MLVPGAPEEARELGTVLAGDACPIDAPALTAAAHEVAVAQHEQRIVDHQTTLTQLSAERDAATDEREAANDAIAVLLARRERLAAGARWCEEEGLSVAALAAGLRQAETDLVAARELAARAHARLEHVGEQRAAATAVLDEARAELADLDAAQLAEPALRRDLEQAVQDLRDAEHGVAAADRRRQETEEAQDALAIRLAEVATDVAALPSVDAAAVERLRATLTAVVEATTGPPDPAAVALAHGITAVDARLDRLGGRGRALPDPYAVDAAEARLAAAEEELAAARAALNAPNRTPGWWQELGALHAVVVDAEAKVTGRGKASRQRYEAALAAERAKLDELGFASYVDALLSGGRLPGEAARTTSNAVAAEAAVAEARAALGAARAAATEAAPIVDALAERRRLVADAAALLGTDTSEDPVPALLQHRSVSSETRLALLQALGAVGASPDEGAPVEVARRWLARHDALNDPARAESLGQTLAALRAEQERLDGELVEVAAEHRRRSEAADAARRAISRLETELHTRVHGETNSVTRAASAAALRDRIVTLETQLEQARTRAEADVSATAAVAEAATAERDRTRHALLGLARQAAKLADEIVPERRPAFDALASLGALAGALRAEADLLTPDLAEAQSRLAAADDVLRATIVAFESHITGPTAGDPTADDAVVALAGLLADGPFDQVSVVVDPLVTDAPDVAARLRDTILHASADRPVVLLTTDHDTLAWAIELPQEDGAVIPLRALVADDRSLTSL